MVKTAYSNFENVHRVSFDLCSFDNRKCFIIIQ